MSSCNRNVSSRNSRRLFKINTGSIGHFFLCLLSRTTFVPGPAKGRKVKLHRYHGYASSWQINTGPAGQTTHCILGRFQACFNGQDYLSEGICLGNVQFGLISGFLQRKQMKTQKQLMIFRT